MAKVYRANDGTFKANLTVDGELKLKEKLSEKLKEIIGDFAGDIIVEYVVMLLRNGKRKEEARNQLNHILGDQSVSFVRWLGQHLTENVDLYLQLKDLQDDGSPKRTNGNQHLNLESERETCRRTRRRNQGWKELARNTGPPPLLWSQDFGRFVQESRARVAQRSSASLKRKRSATAVPQETIFNPPKQLF